MELQKLDESPDNSSSHASLLHPANPAEVLLFVQRVVRGPEKSDHEGHWILSSDVLVNVVTSQRAHFY